MQTANYIRPHTGARKSAPLIRPGDQVRLYDAFYGQYHWHEVVETVTGARPQIKVNGYDWFISASLVNGHRKGARRNG